MVVLLVVITSQMGNSTVNPSLEKVIEVSPAALDVLLHAFDNMVIYFHSEKTESEL